MGALCFIRMLLASWRGERRDQRSVGRHGGDERGSSIDLFDAGVGCGCGEGGHGEGVRPCRNRHSTRQKLWLSFIESSVFENDAIESGPISLPKPTFCVPGALLSK